jgi:hypothetical protein
VKDNTVDNRDHLTNSMSNLYNNTINMNNQTNSHTIGFNTSNTNILNSLQNSHLNNGAIGGGPGPNLGDGDCGDDTVNFEIDNGVKDESATFGILEEIDPKYGKGKGGDREGRGGRGREGKGGRGGGGGGGGGKEFDQFLPKDY